MVLADNALGDLPASIGVMQVRGAVQALPWGRGVVGRYPCWGARVSGDGREGTSLSVSLLPTFLLARIPWSDFMYGAG
jgi:hypothetical protein